ncbi:MAG TPA: L-lactate dehydrogenase [Acidisarcina sp.]|nr:L-lactate dehydrogenase [Acidisarcina sp.]
MANQRTNKIGIIGAGSVGATIAYACMLRGVSQRISLFDVNQEKVNAEVLDLNHGLQFVPVAEVNGSDDMNVLEGSDVIVMTAGAKQKPGQTRMDLAEANANICRKIIPEVLRVAPDAVLLMVTNPVDVMTYIAQKLSGLPANQVLGSGTVLDSSRFRYLIAKRCAVAVPNVHAYIVGEHGDSEIPLWSSASIGAVPLDQWAVPGHGQLTGNDRTHIFESVRTAADQVIAGKGATNYAIGLAASSILEAILNDANRVLPVSSLLTEYRGISGVCLSIPCIVNRRGVEAALPVPMNVDEMEGLKASADRICEVVHSLGF